VACFIDTEPKSDSNTQQKKREEFDKLNITREGSPRPAQIVDAICNLVGMTKDPIHRGLEINIESIEADDAWRDLLVNKMAEKFGMRPVEGSLGSTENKG
jgi:hypothetical protein